MCEDHISFLTVFLCSFVCTITYYVDIFQSYSAHFPLAKSLIAYGFTLNCVHINRPTLFFWIFVYRFLISSF